MASLFTKSFTDTIPASGPYDALTFTFDRAEGTDAEDYRFRLARLTTGAESVRCTAAFLAGYVRSWDALGADGKPTAVSADAIAGLPEKYRTLIFNAVTGYSETAKPAA